MVSGVAQDSGEGVQILRRQLPEEQSFRLQDCPGHGIAGAIRRRGRRSSPLLGGRRGFELFLGSELSRLLEQDLNDLVFWDSVLPTLSPDDQLSVALARRHPQAGLPRLAW